MNNSVITSIVVLTSPSCVDLPPSVEGPMFLSLPQDDRYILSLPTTTLYHPNPTGGEVGGTEEDNPRKSSFRKDAVKRHHSYHFEKPHVSFRLDSDRAPQLGHPQPEAEDTGALPYASHPLSQQYTEGMAPLPAYQRYGSYHGFPYIAPAGGRDQGGSRSRGADELEETESASAVLSATEV